MKHVVITDLNDDGTVRRKILDEDTDMMLAVVDEGIYIAGIGSQLEMTYLVDQALSAFIEYILGVEDMDTETAEIIRTAACLKSIMAINVASTNMGSNGEKGMFATKEDDAEAVRIAEELMVSCERISHLTEDIRTVTSDRLMEALGRQLMEELEELENDEKKE